MFYPNAAPILSSCSALKLIISYVVLFWSQVDYFLCCPVLISGYFLCCPVLISGYFLCCPVLISSWLFLMLSITNFCVCTQTLLSDCHRTCLIILGLSWNRHKFYYDHPQNLRKENLHCAVCLQLSLMRQFGVIWSWLLQIYQSQEQPIYYPV